MPPVPADAAVLLGAFLSRRGVTTPAVVFLVVWLCNAAGALGVYFAARRYGRRLFMEGQGRRLFSPEAIGVIEREYLRFGLVGIFFARFLPGIRAVVPPFAGIINLAPMRAGVPIVLASGIWYGGITIVGALLGIEWDRISALLGRVNSGLAYLTVAVIVLWVAVMYVRARRRRRERIWNAVQGALGGPGADAAGRVDIDARAATTLLLELADATGQIPRLGQRVARSFGRAERLALVQEMWQAAFRDESIGVRQDRLMLLAGDLLGLTAAEVAEARRGAAAAPAPAPPPAPAPGVRS